MKTKAEKYALIIGASKGIGRALAIHLSRIGYTTILIARNKKGLLETQKSCEKYSSSYVISYDICKDQKKLFESIDKITDRIDILWLGAGSGSLKELKDTSVEEIEEVIRVGFESQVKLVKNLLRQLEKANGHIITACSDQFWGPEFNMLGPSVFQSTKIALFGLGSLLVYELRKLNIKVTNLRMGNCGNLEGYELNDHEKQIQETRNAMVTLLDIVETIEFVVKRKTGLVTDLTIIPSDPNY